MDDRHSGTVKAAVITGILGVVAAVIGALITVLLPRFFDEDENQGGPVAADVRPDPSSTVMSAAPTAILPAITTVTATSETTPRPVLTATATATTAPTPTPVPTAVPSPTMSAPGRDPVEVEMADIFFVETDLMIPANTDVTLHVVNQGVTTHTFKIDNPSVYSGNVAPGTSVDVMVNLPPGTYPYYCSVPGHREAGMVGTLTVR